MPSLIRLATTLAAVAAVTAVTANAATLTASSGDELQLKLSRQEAHALRPGDAVDMRLRDGTFAATGRVKSIVGRRAVLALDESSAAIGREEQLDLHVSGEKISRRTSSDDRERSRGLLLAEVGMANSPVVTGAATVGVFLSRNQLVEASYASGVKVDDSSRYSVDLALVRLKSFIGNSFYLNFGAGARRTEAEAVSGYDRTLGLTELDLQDQTSATHLVGEFSLGNRWQFGNFTMGCDWIGIAMPFYEISRREELDKGYAKRGAYDDDEVDEERKDRKEFVEGSGLELLRFSLGVAF